MSEAQAMAKIADRIEYLLGHCDSDEETRLVEWVAGHLAHEFNHETMIVGGRRILSAA
jgi:hypothetical protein